MKCLINPDQEIFEDVVFRNDTEFVFRFTHTKNAPGIYEVRLNELVRRNNGKAEFLWTDDTKLRLTKEFDKPVSDFEIQEMENEIFTAMSL